MNTRLVSVLGATGLAAPAGFEGIVEHVAKLEQQLGIYDLNMFTPT